MIPFQAIWNLDVISSWPY